MLSHFHGPIYRMGLAIMVLVACSSQQARRSALPLDSKQKQQSPEQQTPGEPKDPSRDPPQQNQSGPSDPSQQNPLPPQKPVPEQPCQFDVWQQATAFDVFVFGDLVQMGSDTEGRIVAFGNVNLQNYSVGAALNSNSERKDLIVGGNLRFHSGAISHGGVLVAGSSDVQSAYVFGGVQLGDFPFSHLQEQLFLFSEALAYADVNGSTYVEDFGGPSASITLRGTSADTNYFALHADDLTRANTVVIEAPQSSNVVVNVFGSKASMRNFGFSLQNISRNRVLFHLPYVQQLQIDSIGIEGSIFAPVANVTFNNGVIHGNIVAASLFGNGQINHNPNQGCIPPPKKN